MTVRETRTTHGLSAKNVSENQCTIMTSPRIMQANTRLCFSTYRNCLSLLTLVAECYQKLCEARAVHAVTPRRLFLVVYLKLLARYSNSSAEPNRC